MTSSFQPTIPPFERWCRELQGHLEKACAGLQVMQAWVGVLTNGCSYSAVTGGSAGTQPFDVDVACLAKVVTASLVCDLVNEGRMDLADEVLSYMPATNALTRAALQGVTIAQLLNHTHGLNDSRLGQLPVTSCGNIDLAELLDQLGRAERMSPAGALYNYGNVGAYLAAAILERTYQCSYMDIVLERVLKSIGVSLRLRPCDSPVTKISVCPATGGILFRCDELLAFLRFHLQSTTAFSLMCGSSVPLPGWSPIEKGASLGWKSFGSGWFGHNANMPECTVFTRLHVHRGDGLVIAVRAVKPDVAFIIMGHLFRDVHPELVKVTVPSPLTAQQWSGVNRQNYLGTYENGMQKIVINEKEGALHLMTAPADDGGQMNPDDSIRLRPATQGVFFPERAMHDWLPFLQLVRPGPDGRSQYLWNGRNVWKRKLLQV